VTSVLARLRAPKEDGPAAAVFLPCLRRAKNASKFQMEKILQHTPNQATKWKNKISTNKEAPKCNNLSPKVKLSIPLISKSMEWNLKREKVVKG